MHIFNARRGLAGWHIQAGGIAVAVAAVVFVLAMRTNNDIKARDVQPVLPDYRQGDLPMKTETAMFGAGCFWGVEATFRQLPGVISTRVGYSGGQSDNPTYEEICTDTTGHAEVVEVVYDPAQLSYDKLLEVFWANHDPTQVNRQGPDFGRQYRSAIFYSSPQQQAAAESSKARLDASGRLKRPVATEVTAAATFWPAEDYHQQYLEKRGLSSCHIKQ